MRDVVLDTNVARLFDSPKDARLRPLFEWLSTNGCLAVSQKLLVEYGRHGNQVLAALVRDLLEKKRLNKIASAALKGFDLDKHYQYTCNAADVVNARTVFLSAKKILISFDDKLRNDVNAFPKVDKVKCRAFEYLPDAVLQELVAP